MSYAIRKDGKGWHAVDSKSDCGTNEDFSEAQPIPLVPALVDKKVALLLKIDIDTDAIYGAVVGNRGHEYTDAEAQAVAFKTGAGALLAGNKVQSWATAKSWSATQAADDIIAQAAAWRSAEDAIRANRLAKKEAAKSAANTTALIAIETAWDAFVVAIKSQLGL